MNVISNDSTIHMYVFLEISILDTFMQIKVDRILEQKIFRQGSFLGLPLRFFNNFAAVIPIKIAFSANLFIISPSFRPLELFTKWGENACSSRQ